MREKLETLPMTQLRELAKARNLKGISGLKKAEIIDLLCSEAEKDEAERRDPVRSAASDARSGELPEHTGADRTAEPARPQDSGRNGEHMRQRALPRNAETGRQQESRRGPERSRTPEGGRSPEGERSPEAGRSAEAARRTAQRMVPQERNLAEWENELALPQDKEALDSGLIADGILEVMADGYGFIRCENYLPGENDVYVAPSQIRRFNLKTGDMVVGNTRVRTQGEKFSALLFVRSINGYHPSEAQRRMNFEDMTPVFPDSRLNLESGNNNIAMRMMDIISPVGKGQRGMIVSPPKAGKTTLLKHIAKAVTKSYPEVHLIILLIDERPEEVTDIKESIQGRNVEVIYSTFDELPEHHKRVSEMVIERARRLVEHKHDVMILLDSITRLARAYNLTVPPSGRTLSGGLDPAALHMPKRFFGAARNMREGGSLTILATALVDTGSKMDDVVYEEFKGTGNMEMVLNRKLQEKRVFPAIDLQKSGTRRDDLLLTREELEATDIIHKALNGLKSDDAVEKLIDLFAHTRNNREFIDMVKKIRFL